MASLASSSSKWLVCAPPKLVAPVHRPLAATGRVQVRLASSAPARTPPPARPSPVAGAKGNTPRPAPATPRSPSSSSTAPPSPNGSQPLVLYEGPPQQRPAVSWFLFGSFSTIGLITGYNVSQHLAWPLWSRTEAELVEPRKRYVAGLLVASMSIATASLFKYVASKSITRITLFEPPGRAPMLKIVTATRPIFPRGFFRRAVRPYISEGHSQKEFTAPLENVLRRHGSAVAQGWVNERTGGVERRSITIDIGGDAYLLEGSGANQPVREGMSRVGYAITHFTWRFIRGSPSAPYFWSRQAFDELIPQVSVEARKKKAK